MRGLFSATPCDLTLLADDYEWRGGLARECRALGRRAYELGDRAALKELHSALALIYDHDFTGTAVDEVDHERQPILRDVAARLEQAMLDHELHRIDAGAVTGYPVNGAEYVRWLKRMVAAHPAGRHPLYHRHLAERGEVEDLRLLLAQETNLDPRFDDILAFMQVGRGGMEKMEIAANYWDEMGNGDSALMHARLFAQALESIQVDAAFVRDTFLQEAAISGNLAGCLALYRRHYYKAVGYFGVTEYLAPRRFRCVVDAWRRNGLAEVGVVYHDLHIHVDAGHAAGWFKNVVAPSVESDPRTGRDIAVGAMLRLNSSQDYLDALLRRMEAGSRV